MASIRGFVSTVVEWWAVQARGRRVATSTMSRHANIREGKYMINNEWDTMNNVSWMNMSVKKDGQYWNTRTFGKNEVTKWNTKWALHSSNECIHLNGCFRIAWYRRQRLVQTVKQELEINFLADSSFLTFESFSYSMSAFLRGVSNWLRPKVISPVVNHCLQAVRGMANQRHKKMIKLAKGYRGRANRCFTVAIQRVTKARQYAYRDRKVIIFRIHTF